MARMSASIPGGCEIAMPVNPTGVVRTEKNDHSVISVAITWKEIGTQPPFDEPS
jgi:hypothetical protein